MKINNNLINTFKNKDRPPFYEIWFGWWFTSILTVICNLFNIITFCFWRPYWDMKFLVWSQKRQMIFLVEKKVAEIAVSQKKRAKQAEIFADKALKEIEEGKIISGDVDRNLFS